MVGFDKRIYLIDFGLAQYFCHPMTHEHISQTNGHDLIGTIPYTSINSHMGIQQSRWDDLESMAYTLLFLIEGKLPWQGIPISQNGDHHGVVLRQKQDVCKDFCRSTPSTLTSFLQYTRSLAFDEKPDYVHLHDLVQKFPT